MRFMLLLLLCLPQDDIGKLIDQLSSDSPETREKATAELIKRGAEKELKARLDGADAETRGRIEKVLAGLERLRWTKWKLVRTLVPHDGVIFNFEFSPDGTKILTVGGDEFVRVWETASRTELFAARLEHLMLAKWSPDGARIVGAGAAKAAAWDVAAKKQVDAWDLKDFGAKGILLIDDGAIVHGLNGYLCSRTFGGASVLIEAQRYDQVRVMGDRVVLLAKTGADGGEWMREGIDVSIVELKTGKLLAHAAMEKKGGRGERDLYDSEALLPDGKRFIYLEKGVATVHDIATDKVVRRFGAGMGRLHLASDGDIAIADNGGVWDVEKGGKIGTVAPAETLTWSRDRAVAFSQDDTILVDPRVGKAIASLSPGDRAQFSPDGKYVYVWEENSGKGRLFDASSGAEIAARPAKQTYVLSAVYPATARFAGSVFASIVEGRLALYDVTAKKELGEILGHRSGAYVVGMTAEHIISLSSASSEAVVMETVTGKVVARVPASSWDYGAFVEGGRLVTRPKSGDWIVWELPGCKKLCTVPANASRRVSITGDGAFAVHARDSGTTIIDLATGKTTLTIDKMSRAVCSPKGAMVAMSGAAGLKLVDASTGKGETIVARELRPLKFDATGACLLVAEDSNVRGVVNVAARTFTPLPDGVMIADDVVQVDVAADGSVLAVADCNRGGGVYDVAKGTKLFWDKRVRGHFVFARLSPDGRRVLLGGEHKDKGVYFYDVAGRLLAEYERASTAFAASGQFFAARGTNVEVWTTDATEPVHRIDAGWRVDRITSSADGKTLLIAAGIDLQIWRRE